MNKVLYGGSNQVNVFVALAVMLLLSGCTSPGYIFSYEKVKPWERGALADDAMQPLLDSMDQTADDHIYFSREGSKGGSSVRGGGCGCN